MLDSLFVTRGHTVVVGEVEHGPGAPVALDPAEAGRLAALGFLADTPPLPAAAEHGDHEALDAPGR